MRAGIWIDAVIMFTGAMGLLAGIGNAQQPNVPPETPLMDTTDREKEPVRVLIAGMVHGHVDGFLAGAVKRKDVEIVAVAEPDRALFDAYAKKYGLEAKLYYSDLEEAIGATQP